MATFTGNRSRNCVIMPPLLLLFTAVLQPSSSLPLSKPFRCLSLHLMLLLILDTADDRIFSLMLTPSSVKVFSHWQIWAHQLISILPTPSLNLPFYCWKGYNAVSYPSANWWFPQCSPWAKTLCFTYPILQPRSCITLSVSSEEQ